MFLFFHSEQSAKNANYYKGLLFEGLLTRYLSKAGFAVALRQKHNSLEYDLEGRHSVDGRRVVGEAKAHDRPISGEVVAAFVGKLFPLGLAEHSLSGLLLSTSAITSEAEDYLRAVTARSGSITVFSGERLAAEIRSQLQIPPPASLEKQLEGTGYTPLTSHLLATDVGVFVVLLAANSTSAAATAFVVFREDGTVLQDPAYLAKLAAAVPELASLQGVWGRSVESSRPPSRTIGSGLSVGSSWDDYRLPAAPSLFVGRRSLAKTIEEQIAICEAPAVLQVKSRSGVGKSSFLAYIGEALRKSGAVVELHDARDVKSVFDLLSVVQRFTGAELPAVDVQDAVAQLQTLSARLGSAERAVFMVDQFEATFSSPELFHAYEALLPSFSSGGKMFAVFARKNDLLTTYDDSIISLQRLNALSRPYELRDFDVSEAVELIERIGGSQGKPVASDVKGYVLEFAQGFPWLIKRTMAHVVRLVMRGTSQSELFAAGLRLDELFDEELEGLDELERDYLTRIAARLPANVASLQQHFDEDPRLPRLLDKLTGSRLLRMSGATYDTYNDVFKEYLIYRKLPEYRPAFIHRLFPQAVFRLFHKLVQRKTWSFEELQKEANASTGTTFNLIRELRNLGLLRKEGVHWSIPQFVLDVFARGALGEQVRRQMMENAVIAELLEELTRESRLEHTALQEYLRKRFPFIQATGKTWGTYAAIMLSWLRALRLVDVKGSWVVLPGSSRTEIVEDLGNLTRIGRRVGSRRSERTTFLPASHWTACVSAASMLLSKQEISSNQARKGLSNLRALALVGEKDQPLFSDLAELKTKAQQALLVEPYAQIWSRLSSGQEIETVVKALEARDAAQATVAWRCSLFVHWGDELGLIRRVDQLRTRAKKHRPAARKSTRR